MNLALTNRVKIDLVSPFILIGLFAIASLVIKSCQSDNGFRVEHSARMGGGFVPDTNNHRGTYTSLIVDAHRNSVYDKWEYDTIYPPKTTPQIKVSFSQLYLKKLDTLNLIVNNYLGSSLTVDNANQLKQIFFRITNELRNDTTHAK